eukprot:3032604-Pyramimonas_sp.AAC.1
MRTPRQECPDMRDKVQAMARIQCVARDSSQYFGKWVHKQCPSCSSWIRFGFSIVSRTPRQSHGREWQAPGRSRRCPSHR